MFILMNDPATRHNSATVASGHARARIQVHAWRASNEGFGIPHH
jgi:hypothetical protein